MQSSTSPYLQPTNPTILSTTTKPVSTNGNAFTDDKDLNTSNESTGKRKILRKRIVRKIVPRRKFRKGKGLRRKRFRQNKHQEHFQLKIPELNSELDGHFPLHTVKKDINIYNSYGNRAVYYKIYNGNKNQ